MIRNIIFDWSGTLVDDLPAVWQATNYVLAQAKRPEMSLEQFRAEFCLPFTIFYERHTPHVPLAQLEGWFHSRFRQVQDSVCALPHAREFLEFCRAANLRTFLLSTVHRDHFAVQSASTGFGPFLDKGYLNVWDKREKIHEILEENGLVPDETLFIGDMQHDIETARHGGIHSCAVLTGYNTLDQLRAAQAGPDRRAPGRTARGIAAERPAPQAAGEAVRGEPSAHRDRRRADLQRRPPGADGSHAQVVESLGHSRRQDQMGRELPSRRCAARSKRRRPGGHGHRVCAGAGLHSLERVLSRCAFRAVELHVPMRGPPAVKLNDEAREFRWVTAAEAMEMPLNQPTRTLLLAVREQE